MKDKKRRENQEEVVIPDKLYYKIGEVSEIIGVEPYVLRYWESEFGMVKPIRGKSKQRLYRRKDLESVLEIKKLLYKEEFTIAGAKRKLRESRSQGDGKPQAPLSEEGYKNFLKGIRDELEIIKDILE